MTLGDATPRLFHLRSQRLGEAQRQALALKARSKTWSVTVYVGLCDYLGGRTGQSDPGVCWGSH